MPSNRFAPTRPLMVLAIWSMIGVPGASAQLPIGGMAGVSGFPAPQFEADGLWARVISVTPKWLVLENALGQQFPVSFGAIDVFAIRWPANPAMAGRGTLAEVTGLDQYNGRVVAGHVDLYEGSARALVNPTSFLLAGFNRGMTPTNPYQMNTFGRFSILPDEGAMPFHRHVVGPLISANPMIVAVPGNQAVMVVPGGVGLSVTQVTIGSPSFVRPGDFVWCLPVNANPQTLSLARIVVYKHVPLAEFVP